MFSSERSYFSGGGFSWEFSGGGGFAMIGSILFAFSGYC